MIGYFSLVFVSCPGTKRFYLVLSLRMVWCPTSPPLLKSVWNYFTCTELNYTSMYCTALNINVLQSTSLHCFARDLSENFLSLAQLIAVHCTIHIPSVDYRVLHYPALIWLLPWHHALLQAQSIPYWYVSKPWAQEKWSSRTQHRHLNLVCMGAIESSNP